MCKEVGIAAPIDSRNNVKVRKSASHASTDSVPKKPSVRGKKMSWLSKNKIVGFCLF
jgi:hypothetical protein